jgi:hypothetical protein
VFLPQLPPETFAKPTIYTFGMKKTYLAALLALTGLLSNGISASAETTQVEAGFSYQVLPDNTASIINCVDMCSATDPVIPATLGGFPVSKIEARAFEGDGLSGTLTMPATITEIGQAAFLRNSLSAITFPATFVKVGNSAFSRNQLAALTVPAWMSTVPDDSFSYNPLTSLVIPEGVKTIGAMSFYDSTRSVKIVVMPKSLTKLGVKAFACKFRWGSAINFIFLGKAPTFPKPAYKFVANIEGEEDDAELLVAESNYASWKKLDPYEGCRKDCLFVARVPRLDLLTTVPNKPKATWARLNMPAVPGSSYTKPRNVFFVQLSGNNQAGYLRAKKPNIFDNDDMSSTMTFVVPPPGFAKVLKGLSGRILTENSYRYFEYPDNNSTWSYFEFKPQRDGWLQGVAPLEGEHLVGSLTLAERKKMPRYYCKYVDNDLSCKKK